MNEITQHDFGLLKREARLLGNERAADQLETKAATSPAMTSTVTWAAELTTAEGTERGDQKKVHEDFRCLIDTAA